MREYLFHGKRTDNGEWVEGWYVPAGGEVRHCIFLASAPDMGEYVDPKTVGQFTGLPDKNGTKIFEGDILKDDWGKIYKVFFSPEKCAFLARIDHAQNDWEKGNYCMGVDWCDTIRVIGNIYDNPELLEA